MRGKNIIAKIDKKTQRGLLKEYGNLVFKEKIKRDLYSAKEIIKEVILAVGALSGVVILAAVAPNIIGAIGKISRKNQRVYFNCNQKKFNQSLSYLKHRQFAKVNFSKNGATIKLTNKGRVVFSHHLLESIKIEQNKKWDGYWRVVLFDIPESAKNAREALRQRLQNMGFCQLQKSAFIIPYPCEKEISFIKEIFGLGDQVRLLLVKSISGEQAIKNFFGI